jgi:sugar (pentulose or hexulose) kinase
MAATSVIAVFDVGKTNKKLFLIDEHYKIVWERTARFSETVDEDGFPCENLENMRASVFESLREVGGQNQFGVKAVNFSTYGASFVYLNENGKPIASLYNYLKPYPETIQKQFYDTYGGASLFSHQTASPVLGSLNSGLQLYRIKKEKPDLFRHIKTALHLPQYMSYLLTGKCYSDMTSIGCHTGLWDFRKQDYHEWVYAEGIIRKLAPILPSDHVELSNFRQGNFPIGIGLHDSSAALIPYLVSFQEPFVLISTGTWCISLNPFNQTPLTQQELENDCLCYLTYEGKPVKASRLFAGKEHEEQTERIGAHFHLDNGWYRSIEFDQELVFQLQKRTQEEPSSRSSVIKQSVFARRELDGFASPEDAYHQLMLDIIREQYTSTQWVVAGSPVKRIFVDGGFSKNPVYMNLLAAAFPHLEVFAASVAQATAIGAALAIHSHWNRKALPADIIELKYYSLPQELTL